MLDRFPFLEKELLLLRRLVRPGDVCVDIGAAGGAHLLVMARNVGAHGTVVGVEPRRGSYRILRRVVRIARFSDRVRLVRSALADRPGQRALRIPVVPTRAHLRGAGVTAERDAAFARLPHRWVQVPVSTLDDLVVGQGLERLDVVKCDVEGAELPLFEGASRTLRELRPLIIVEADDEHQRRNDTTAQDVLDFIADHGYRTCRYRRGALDEVDGVIEDEDDYVMIPDEMTPPIAVRGAA